MKKKIGIILPIVIFTVYATTTIFRNKTQYPELFKDYGQTYCITTGKNAGIGGWSSGIGYQYKVGDVVYEGSYTLNEEERFITPNGKYLIVYSKKDPSYHVIFNIKIGRIQKTQNIKINEREIKKKFDINNRAKIIRSKFESKGKSSSVDVPDITVSPR